MTSTFAIISALVTLLTMVFAIFGAAWLNQRATERYLDQLDKRNADRFSDMEKRFSDQEKMFTMRLSEMEKRYLDRFAQIEWRLDQMEKSASLRFEQMEKSVSLRFEQMEKSVSLRFEQMEKHLDARLDVLRTEFRSEIRRIDQRIAAIEGWRGEEPADPQSSSEMQQPERDLEQIAAD